MVIFEKREHTNESAVNILNQILRTGYVSDEGGTRTDFTKSVILIVLKGLPPAELIPCACRTTIRDKPFKTYLDATSVCPRAARRCQWVAMLKKVLSDMMNSVSLVNFSTWYELMCLFF